MAKPRVSVICIFYNAERFLGEAIDSVIAQDCSDFELILVDDGSTDSSRSIAEDSAAAHPGKVRVLTHAGGANRGMSASRNLGIGEARGEIIAFIDADDRWKPAKLREQLRILDTYPQVDAAFGAVNYWRTWEGGSDEIIRTGHVQDQPIPPPEAALRLYPLGKASAPCPSDLMVRRSAVLALSGFEESFTGPMQMYEDQAFFAKLYLSRTVYFASDQWLDYRIHDESCVSEVTRAGQYAEVRRRFLQWLSDYLRRSDHKPPLEVSLAVKRALLATGAQSLRNWARQIVPDLRSAAREVYARVRPLLTPGPAVLMYHRIADEEFDPWGLAVSPANFAEHLEWIQRNRTTLELAEFVELNQRAKLPRDAIALTFDDGYACNATTAAPLLDVFGIPATVFISPLLIERGSEFWWDELERIVLGHDGDSLRLDGGPVALGQRRDDDHAWPPAAPSRTPRQRAYRELWSRLHGRAPIEIERAMVGLREQAQVSEKPRDSHRPLSKQEVQTIRSDLVAFGSHALTHASLPRLSRSEQEHEIAGSVEPCKALTGVRPLAFAYPHGDYVPELEHLVQNAGFACACRANGWFVTHKTSPFALPRVSVRNSGSDQLALRLGRP